MVNKVTVFDVVPVCALVLLRLQVEDLWDDGRAYCVVCVCSVVHSMPGPWLCICWICTRAWAGLDCPVFHAAPNTERVLCHRHRA